uniref:probable phospholipid hydroperoxide glutathione peroxidase n=1 Tax=Fragaria vesca subsp. vesca TaxID=101020 RepID=UPI0005C94A5D|nr:PREDICTED: probable phospholipid hydroperoxide glutathione peroxidase [Fragaria vesca subsp. vesca]XP_011466860.1 PREDICTED: probable phospholipid hydroperoxide glutathione peroxidase [Fragaria vesca subsp. vesca]XP_011466861.1 PREDICTED: probable phospholipid hydroperoxide glutathione peroxidase [Fragaria vesca subsp. vesca]
MGKIQAQERLRLQNVHRSVLNIHIKIEVNGKNEAPLYKFLKLEKGGLFGNGIKWNFTKFLVNKEGKVVERYALVTAPLKIEKDIQNLLESS